ncbi:DgyrCDS12326 [Dimorphilus gyrociliatus]|uniref:DgyrCDS12326 n=1 Tax=Dimorphilus gyrociliatus TaxID=2664684 RepID=A0A7I8W7B2_9ANNE|nr:DgyrCDS12326 [Dimorphilus gyrociliatus]
MLASIFHCLRFRNIHNYRPVMFLPLDQLALSEPKQCETNLDCKTKHSYCKVMDTSTGTSQGNTPPTTIGQGQTTSMHISTAGITKSNSETTKIATTKADELTTQSETINETTTGIAVKPTTVVEITTQNTHSQAITTEGSENHTEGTTTNETISELTTNKEFTSRATQTTDKTGISTTMNNVISTEKQITEQFTTEKAVLERTTYSPSPIKRCVCDSSAGWFKDGDTCKNYADLYDPCSSITICKVRHSHCVFDGVNVQGKRCKCKTGYIDVQHNGTLTCGQIITHYDDPTCSICEKHEGICYSSTGNGRRDGCKCKSSRQGVDCEKLLVNVYCSVPANTMTICFKPTNRFNFKTGNSVLHAKGKGKDEACKGKPADKDSICDKDSIALVLSWKEENRRRCGTNHYTDGKGERTYDNVIVAAEDSKINTQNDLYFNTYCKFRNYVQNTFKGIAVHAVPGNDRGETKLPNLQFAAEFQTGKLIDPSYPVRVGDKIRLIIKMTDVESYSAILVTEMTASSSFTKPDPKAVTVPLIMNGCPYENQKTFTNENMWKVAHNDPRQLRTGLIRMFKLSKGSSVFFHSTVRICLIGEEIKCKLHNCTWPLQKQQSRRKKRALKTSEEIDTLELRWYEDTGNSSNGGLTALFCVIAIATLALIGITVFFVITKKKITFKKPEVWTTLPQRFAIPRLDQNKHIRIREIMSDFFYENESRTSSPKQPRWRTKISPTDRFSAERSSLRSTKSNPAATIHVKPKEPLRKTKSLPTSNTEGWNKTKEDLRKKVLLKMDESVRLKREKEAICLIEEQRREEKLRKEKEEKQEKVLKLQAIRGQIEEEKTVVYNVVSHINDDKEEEKLFMKLFIKKMLSNPRAKMILQNFVLKYKQSQKEQEKMLEKEKEEATNEKAMGKIAKIYSDSEGKTPKFMEKTNFPSTCFLPELEKKPVFRTSSVDSDMKDMSKQELRQYVQALHKIVDGDIKSLVKGQKKAEKTDKLN